jgi:hypothetical protein
LQIFELAALKALADISTCTSQELSKSLGFVRGPIQSELISTLVEMGHRLCQHTHCRVELEAWSHGVMQGVPAVK